MAKTTFAELIQNPDTPVLVDFYADWCGPCKALAPILTQVAAENNGKVKVIKVDVDKNQAAANQYRIQGVPTLLLFKNGQVVWRQSGVVPVQQLNQVLRQHAG